MSLSTASWPQWLAAITVFQMTLVMSLESGWTSPALAILLSSESPIPTSKTDASWIASILSIGKAVGGLVGAIDVEIFGSKTAVLHIGLVQVLGLILLAIAESVSLIEISRFICGVASGMVLIAFPLYMGEISNSKIRGALVGLVSSGMSIGYVLGNLTGAYMSIADNAIMCLSISILFIITFYWLPNSPHYFVLKNETEKAGGAILWYQRDANVQKELESLRDFIKAKQSMTFRALLDEFMLPHNRTALFNVIIIYILIQLSGYFTIGFYMEIILTQAQVSVISPALAVAVVSTAAPVGGIIAMLTIDRFGRKFLMVTTAIGLAVCVGLMGLHFQLQETGRYQPEHIQWLMLTAALVFEAFVSLGVIPIPNTILSETFAPNIKSYSSCVANIFAGVAAFLVTQTYQVIVDYIDFYVYYCYALTIWFPLLCLLLWKCLRLRESRCKKFRRC